MTLNQSKVLLALLLLIGCSHLAVPVAADASSSDSGTIGASNSTVDISLGLIWDSDEAIYNLTDLSAQLLPSIKAECPSSPRVNRTKFLYAAFNMDSLPTQNELQSVVDALSTLNYLFFGVKQNSVTHILDSMAVPTLLPEYPMMQQHVVAPMPPALLVDAMMKVIRQRVNESWNPSDPFNFRAALFHDRSVSISSLYPLITYFSEGFIYFNFTLSEVEANLLKAKSAQVTNIIVIIMNATEGRILRDRAFDVNMFTSRYRWFIHGPRLINEGSEVDAHITSLNVTSIEFGRISDTLSQGIWSTTGVFVHDLLSIWRPFLKNYVCNEKQSVNQTLSGFTGKFARKADGSATRLNWQLGVFAGLGRYKTQVGEWTSDGRFYMLPRKDSTRGPSQLLDELRANRFRVATVIYPPFIQFHSGYTNCSAPCRRELTGMYVETCKLLLENLNITNYEFLLQPDNAVGVFNGTTWNGVIKTVMDGKALLGCVPVTVNADRFRIVDFTQIIHSSRVSLLLRRKAGDPISATFQFIMPLTYQLWFSILGVLVLVALCLYVINKIATDRHANYDMYNSVFFAFAEVVQGTGGATPSRVSGRILVAFFWFFTLFLFLSYVANYAAFRTLDGVKQEVTSINSLIENREYDSGSIANTVTDSLLKSSAYLNMQQLYRLMTEAFPNGSVTLEAALSLVSNPDRNFVLINDNLQNQYHRDRGCDLISTGDFYDLKNSMILPKGNDFLDLFDAVLTKIRVNITALQTKFFTLSSSERQTCYDGSFASALRYYIPQDSWPIKPGALTLSDTLGIAIINLVGCCIAIALAGFEKAIGKWQSQRTHDRREDQLVKPTINKFSRPTT